MAKKIFAVSDKFTKKQNYKIPNKNTNASKYQNNQPNSL
jgi:hypothetical protein